MWTSILLGAGKLLVWGAQLWFERRAHDETARKEFIKFLEIMQRKGMVSVEMRLKAEKQISAIAELWAKENQTPKP